MVPFETKYKEERANLKILFLYGLLPRFGKQKMELFMETSVEDYGISEVTWYRHIVEALELRPEAARVRAP